MEHNLRSLELSYADAVWNALKAHRIELPIQVTVSYVADQDYYSYQTRIGDWRSVERRSAWPNAEAIARTCVTRFLRDRDIIAKRCVA